MAVNDNIVINERERAVSDDINNIESIMQRFWAEVVAGGRRLSYGSISEIFNVESYQPNSAILHGLDVAGNNSLNPPPQGFVRVYPGAMAMRNPAAAPPPAGSLDSEWKFGSLRSFIDVDVNSPTPGTDRLGILCCRPTAVVTQQEIRQVFNPVTQQFDPQSVPKVVEYQLEFIVHWNPNLDPSLALRIPPDPGPEWTMLYLVGETSSGETLVAGDWRQVWLPSSEQNGVGGWQNYTGAFGTSSGVNNSEFGNFALKFEGGPGQPAGSGSYTFFGLLSLMDSSFPNDQFLTNQAYMYMAPLVRQDGSAIWVDVAGEGWKGCPIISYIPPISLTEAVGFGGGTNQDFYNAAQLGYPEGSNFLFGGLDDDWLTRETPPLLCPLIETININTNGSGDLPGNSVERFQRGNRNGSTGRSKAFLTQAAVGGTPVGIANGLPRNGAGLWSTPIYCDALLAFFLQAPESITQQNIVLMSGTPSLPLPPGDQAVNNQFIDLNFAPLGQNPLSVVIDRRARVAHWRLVWGCTNGYYNLAPPVDPIRAQGGGVMPWVTSGQIPYGANLADNAEWNYRIYSTGNNFGLSGTMEFSTEWSYNSPPPLFLTTQLLGGIEPKDDFLGQFFYLDLLGWE